ncbi:MAG: dihydrolipoamide acetyltransferase family protein [Pseudomonadota bacterium]
MGLFVIRMSDVGEGVAEVELTEWHVGVGDQVAEDQLICAVMTDKAAIDVPSSVHGEVRKLCADVGDIVAVGSDLIHIEIDGDADTSEMVKSPTENIVAEDTKNSEFEDTVRGDDAVAEKGDREAVSNDVSKTVVKRVLAAPSVRQRARELGIDISTVSGSGPAGRVVHSDLDDHVRETSTHGGATKVLNTDTQVIKVVGMRRKIAEKMSLSKSRIPHITIVEEVDVQYLEELRAELNERHSGSRTKLTILPFVMKSIVEAVQDQPALNSLYDDDANTITQYGGVHIGVATQTDNGLVVPVVRHSEANSLWQNASEVLRLANECREGTAAREELTGSTITITSLGALGALATTPIINYPEVAIVGINKMSVRPFWDGQQFVPRKMMNLSCSFDHRVIDGWDAAVFVNKLKTLLEKPAMLFLDD